jgi:hypothetical protein
VYEVAATTVAAVVVAIPTTKLVTPVVLLDTEKRPPPMTVVVVRHVMSNSIKNGMLVIEAVRVRDGEATIVTGVPAFHLRVITVVPGAAAVVTVPQTRILIVFPIRVQDAGKTAVPTPVPRIFVIAVAAPLVPVAV